MSNVRTTSTSSLWDFSLKLYSQDGVETACLELQDEYGVDINLMFYLLWRSQSGTLASVDDVTKLDGQIRSWREIVVEKLRQLRRDLKSMNVDLDPAVLEKFRGSIKDLELSSEALAQKILLALNTQIDTTIPEIEEAAACNLSVYESFLKTEFPAHTRVTILSALKLIR